MPDPVRPADYERGPMLDMAGYSRLGRDRLAFDDWLREQGLLGESIFYIRFGEGYVEAMCYLDPRRLVEGTDEIAWEWRRFAVTSLPPVRIDGSGAK